MINAEWSASMDPAAMLAEITFRNQWFATTGGGHRRTSDRKLRLFACACCRLCWSIFTDDISRQAVGVAEAFADGIATASDIREAWCSVWPTGRAAPNAVAHTCEETGLDAATYWVNEGTAYVPALTQANLLRCVAGNLVNPVPKLWGRLIPGGPVILLGEHTHWLTTTVLALTLAAYAEPRAVMCGRCKGTGQLARAPKVEVTQFRQVDTASVLNPFKRFEIRRDPCPDCKDGTINDGLLDLDRLAVLADALEDAGCNDQRLLGHLRDHNQHARGCHVLDMLLGKEHQ